MSNGHYRNELIFGRGGGITSNITLLEPERYKEIQEDAIRHLDTGLHTSGAEDLQLIKEVLGLDDLSTPQ